MTATGSTEPTSIGRYELSSTLGVGGFATVYRAHDPALDADVAVKVMLPRFVADGDVRGRFLQEARLLRRVESPNLIRVYDIGELEDGRPYFVMELAEGGVLGSRFRGRIDRRSLARVIDSLEAGLGALHRANIVHRDIKPDNLLVSGTNGAEVTEIGATLLAEDERLLIGDLGLAKDREQTSAGPTVAGGTPLYRPPEQMTGDPVTPAADIYAATAVLWFLLTGTHPPETTAVPVQLNALPPAWQPVMDRGLQADPTLRHISIAEWAGDARRALDDSPDTGFEPIRVGDSRSLCPYKGMAAFQPEDAGLFFGRDDLVDTLVARLQDHPVVVIGGASGSGKSSLMRAGLIPRLSRGAIAGSQQWRVALFNPGTDAVGELLHQIGRLANSSGAAVSTQLDSAARPTGAAEPTVRSTGPGGTSTEPAASSTRPAVTGQQEPPPATMASPGGGPPVVVPARADLPNGARRLLDDGPPVVLAIDQFEELFTLNPTRADRELFLDTLADLTRSAHSRIRVVVALRADFYGVCAGHPWLNDRINEGQLLVGPMSRQELRDAITLPAQRAGMALEDGLADLILDDVGSGSGALPLLGHALMETWLRRRGSHLTVEGYRAAGGVTGAIAQRAEDVYRQLDDDDVDGEQALARRLLLQLVNPGQGTPDTRRRVDRGSLPDDPAMAGLLEKLAAARLLTVDDTAVEVAHEALIQTWPRLQSWIDGDRENLQIRRRIGAAAAEWESQGRNPDLLYRGTQLAQALEWLAEHPDELEPVADEFVVTAREDRDDADRERMAGEIRRRRNRRLAFAALAVLAGAAVVASVVAFVFLGRARTNQREAEAQQVQALAAAAAGNAGDQPLLATGLALESIARSEPSTAAARAALVESRVGLDENRWLPQPFGHPIPVGDALAVAITPDGETFITGDRVSGDVVFWDRVSRAPVHRVAAHDGGVNHIAVSADGRWMATVSEADAKLWDLAADEPAPTLLHELDEAGRPIWEVAFSADGSMIGLATEAAGVLIFDRAGRSMISDAMSEVLVADVLSVAFLDAERLAAGTGDGKLYMVDVATGDTIGPPVEAHESNDIWQLVPDRERNLLMTVSNDNSVKSWNVEPGGFSLEAELDDIDHPAGAVLARDGTELIIGAIDGRLYRSDPATGELIPNGVSATLHTDEVGDAALSDNGWLVTLGNDQRVQIWRYIGDLAEVDEELTSLPDPIIELALSPSGQRLVSATAAGAVITDAVTGQILTELGGAVETVVWVTEDRVATASADGRLQLWDVGPATVVAENAGHDGRPIRGLMASSDGQLIVSSGDDGRVIAWSGDDLSEVRVLAAHDRQVTAVDFTPDEDTVVSLGWDQQMRFSPVDGGESRSVTVPIDGPQTLVVHPGGDLLAVGSADENIHILDRDGNEVRSMAPHRGGVWDLALTADGQSIAATSRSRQRQAGELQLWDWDTGERLGPSFGNDDEPGRRESDVVVGADDTVWWSGTDGAIRRLDVLVPDIGCRISQDVIGPQMREQFLSGDQVMGC